MEEKTLTSKSLFELTLAEINENFELVLYLFKHGTLEKKLDGLYFLEDFSTHKLMENF